MKARIATIKTQTPNALTDQLVSSCQQAGFKGDIYTDIATRLLHATDNSVYQLLPSAVFAPRNSKDIITLVKLLNTSPFDSISLTARGGGTGTNGQALNTGIIVDCSKYLNNILEINLEQGFARVQPGVVLDQLNNALKPYQCFFAPSVSTSSRATLGGMTNTDACGKGSRLYGKTSQHIIEISAIYSDGEHHTSQSVDLHTLANLKQLPGVVGRAYQQVDETVCRCQAAIEQQFPKLTRYMTGYDLAHVYDDNRSVFNLNAVLCGSEGTLAIIDEIKVKLTPIPKYKRLVVLQYHDFHDALADAKELLAIQPAAIETIDGTILNLAKDDIIYEQVKDYVSNHSCDTGGVNYIEWVGDDERALDDSLDQLNTVVSKHSRSIVAKIANSNEDITALWELRKKSVGLLGKLPGARKPMSGIEDTVVPPERLADFIKDFRAILDKHHLTYGMFGHVDAGCLHVRPAYNMIDPKDESLYFEITEQIAKLAKQYGGLLWGEHGKGIRSHYVPMFFGTELYPELKKIKQAFDPSNRFNPGKIATPADTNAELLSIQSPLRALNDKHISELNRNKYLQSLSCNGNGACFDYDPNHTMCPSYKVSRDRRYSPKGRASLVREWLGKIASHNTSTLEKQVYDSFDHCLGCKACVTGCPVNINIPDQKAKFLQTYHQRNPRPWRDYLLAHAEKIAIKQARHPWLFNRLGRSQLFKRICKHIFKLQDLPVIAAPNLDLYCMDQEIPSYTPTNIEHIDSQHTQAVIVVDSLNSSFEPRLVSDCHLLLKTLGINTALLTEIDSGKPMQVRGFLNDFKRTANSNAMCFNQLSERGIALIGIDPSITLCLNKEYSPAISEQNYQIELIQHYLLANMGNHYTIQQTQEITLLLHCSESSDSNQHGKAWQQLFEKFGLVVSLESVGCCGMAGSYGLESHHIEDSKKLFNMSWQQHMRDERVILATGFSCRCQIKRCSTAKPMHPIQYLLQQLHTFTAR